MPIELQKQRTKRGWSQKRLATRLGLNQSTISLWERQLRRPYRRTEVQLERIFGLDIETLLTDSGTTKAIVLADDGSENPDTTSEIQDDQF